MANRTTNSISRFGYQISLVNGVSAVVPPEEDNPNGHSYWLLTNLKLVVVTQEMLTI